MKKPRAINHTGNFCGECYFFVDDHCRAESGILDEKDGLCDICGGRVEYNGGACKHFRYTYEGGNR